MLVFNFYLNTASLPIYGFYIGTPKLLPGGDSKFFFPKSAQITAIKPVFMK